MNKNNLLKPSRQLSKRQAYLIVIGLLSLIGGIAIFYSTANGPAGFSDSASYIVQARNFLRGIGLGVYWPDGRFNISLAQPPFYPVLLSAIGLFGVDLVVAARWIDILAAILSILGCGLLFLDFSGSPALFLPAILLVAVYRPGIFLYSMAMTEALFLCLACWSLYFLMKYLRQDRTRWLVMSALLAGWLPMIRFPGLALIAVGVVALLVFGKRAFLKRLGCTLLYLGPASFALLVWVTCLNLFYHLTLAGIGVHPNLSELAAHFVDFRLYVVGFVWNWIPFNTLIPIPTQDYRSHLLLLGFLTIFLFALPFVLRCTVYRHRNALVDDQPFQLFFIAGLSLLFLLLFLLAAYLIHLVSLDDRQSLPLYVLASISLVAIFGYLQTALFQGRRRGLQVLPWLVLTVLVVWQVPAIAPSLETLHGGFGYTTDWWRNSTTIKAVRALPAGTPIVSNYAAAIMLWTDRPGWEILEQIHPAFIAQTGLYGSDTTDKAQVAFREHGGVLVIFNPQFPTQMESAFGPAGTQRVSSMLNGLKVVGTYSDGTIYVFPSQP